MWTSKLKNENPRTYLKKIKGKKLSVKNDRLYTISLPFFIRFMRIKELFRFYLI